MKWLTFFVPESGLLLLVGLIVSHVAWGVDEVFMYVNDTRSAYLTSYHIECEQQFPTMNLHTHHVLPAFLSSWCNTS